MDILLIILIIFIILELFESTWQKAPSLYGLLAKNYSIYRKNIFFYFIIHTTFFYSLFLSFYLNNFSFWMSSIVIMKFLDLYLKLIIMKKIDNNLDLGSIIPLDIKMTNVFRYFNVIIYPLSFIFAVI